MKKAIITAAFALLIAATTAAQLKIFPNSQVRIGRDWYEEQGYDELFSNQLDTITRLKVMGVDEYGNQSWMSFGMQKFHNDLKVLVGNVPEEGCSTDRLWLHGKFGFAVTQNQHANDTVMQFNHNENFVDFRYPVKTEQVLLSSDKRLKENVKKMDGALQTLAELEGVTYNLKPRKAFSTDEPALADYDIKNKEYFDRYYANLEAERCAKLRYGFIAQDVEKVLPDLVQRDKDGMMSVDYIAVIPILVNAVNELSGELAEVKAKNEQLEQQLEAPAVNRAPTQSSGMDQLFAGKAAEVLAQNDPNPFNSDTRIAYSLPEGTQQAAIYIYDLQGKQVRQLPVADMGAGSVTLHGGDLQAGMYIYSLIADGHELASKKMILTK